MQKYHDVAQPRLIIFPQKRKMNIEGKGNRKKSFIMCQSVVELPEYF